jgi:hypothetical protein
MEEKPTIELIWFWSSGSFPSCVYPPTYGVLKIGMRHWDCGAFCSLQEHGGWRLFGGLNGLLELLLLSHTVLGDVWGVNEVRAFIIQCFYA